MNFLVDESVDRQIVDVLRRDDHVVLYVAEIDPGIIVILASDNSPGKSKAGEITVENGIIKTAYVDI